MSTTGLLIADQTQPLINVGVGLLLPPIVAAVTHRLASSVVKSLLLLALAAAGGVITSAGANALDWRSLLDAFMTQFAAAVIAHYGLLKPTGITGSAGAIARALPSGLGAAVAADVAADAHADANADAKADANTATTGPHPEGA